MKISQSTQFKIEQMSLSTEFGSFDISGAFSELALYDNVYSPCMTGSVIILDAISLLEKLRFDGNEYITIKIGKSSDDSFELEMFKTYRVYKVSDIVNINQTSKTYILHFITPDFLLSEQIKVSQFFSSSYSNMVSKILKNYLQIGNSPVDGKSRVNVIESTKGTFSYIAPTITPFQTIAEIARRAVSQKNKPDFLFFETFAGYNFKSLTTMFSQPTKFRLNFSPKNIDDNIAREFLGVRNMKILTQSSVVENIRSGTLAGKFVGFDTLTRKIKLTNLTTQTIHDASPDVTLQTNVGDLTDVNKFGAASNQMVNSRIVFYPFTTPRSSNEYIKASDPSTANLQDNTQEYKFHRKAIMTLLGQKRMELAIPGNFGIMAGDIVQLDVPKYSVKTDSIDGELDPMLSGRYLVTATRHSINSAKHETYMEVSSIHTKKRK